MDGRAARLGGAVTRARRGFARWRWTRPFWGGLLLILSGLELFASTQGGADLNGLSVHVGPSGYLSWLIPAVLATCGLLIWCSPAQRVFYAVIGAVTAVFSLMAVNLGGFFIGLLLGAARSALAFGWTPPDPAAESDEPASDEPASDEPASGEAGADEPVAEGERGVGDEAGPKGEGDGGPGTRTGPERGPGTVEEQKRERPRGYGERVIRPARSGRGARRTPLSIWIGIVVVSGAAGFGVLPGTGAAHARPCPSPSAPPSPSASASSRSPGPIGGLLDDLTGGLGGLLGIGGAPGPGVPAPSLAPAPAPAPSATGDSAGADGPCGGTPPVGPGAPGPGQSAAAGEPGGTGGPDPGPGSGPGGSGRPGADAEGQVAQLGIPAGVPPVAMRPSLLTGTRVEMWNLGIDGIVDMPRADGSTVKALQFSMAKAYTHDFRLDTPRHPDLSPITSVRLGVEGDVRFYATRFTGTLLGIPLTLTPESPLPPDGIPIALPYIAFDDPSMELLLATGRVLTGPDLVDRF